MATAVCPVEAPPTQGGARVESGGSKWMLGEPTEREAASRPCVWEPSAPACYKKGGPLSNALTYWG